MAKLSRQAFNFRNVTEGPQKVAQAATKRNVIPIAQARQILQIPEGELTRALIHEAYERHFAANDPEKGGSYYLQCKVYHAREALMAELPDHEQDSDDEEEEEEEEGPPKEIDDGNANKNDR